MLREIGLADIYTTICAGNIDITQEIKALIEVPKACSFDDQIQCIFMGDGTKHHLIEKSIGENNIGNARLLPY